MTPSCQSCRFFTAVKEEDVTLRFYCSFYSECRGGKEGAGLYIHSFNTERAWNEWVRERKP